MDIRIITKTKVKQHIYKLYVNFNAGEFGSAGDEDLIHFKLILTIILSISLTNRH